MKQISSMNILKKMGWGLTFLAGLSSAQAQELAVLDMTKVEQTTPTTLPMQGINPSGNTLAVNNQYFVKNGEPWYPLMGEIHYNRVNPQDWESALLKMKSGGLGIVATYVFWNEHETQKGKWDWEKGRNLRRFVELCSKHGLYVWLRIGPWSHGEQLHGGHPDWINSMKGKRSNDPTYLAEASRFFQQIGEQTNGLYFKNGGPIIGVQLENEYASGQAEHISTLKKMALSSKIEPVYWSVTANTVFDDTKEEVIPLQGGYPYRGWEKGGGKATKDFLYGNDQWIMTDALGKVYYDTKRFPKGMCEQGCGSQVTYANRFVVEPHIVEAHLQNQIGRGMNMMGYYMFHGGTQSPGLKEPGCPENYDFQAPISEFGYLRPSYKYLKILHHFANDFGKELVQMKVVEAPNPLHDELNTEQVRYIGRVKDNQGFVFFCNAQVRVPMLDKQVALQVKLPHETINFPKFTLKGQTSPILPFNLNLNGILVKYALAQPFAKVENEGNLMVFFQKLNGVEPQLALDRTTIKEMKSAGWSLRKEGGLDVVSSSQSSVIELKNGVGKRVTLVFLTRAEAENAWRVNLNGKQALVLSEADMVVKNNEIGLLQLKLPTFVFKIYPANTLAFETLKKMTESTVWDNYTVSVPQKQPALSIKKLATNTIEIGSAEAFPAYINDVFVKVDYRGGQAEMWQGEKLKTDHLFNGIPWLLGLKNYLPFGPLSVRLADWNNNITGISVELANNIKKIGPSFNAIEVIPQYKTSVRIKP